jgi:hypothetical protein
MPEVGDGAVAGVGRLDGDAPACSNVGERDPVDDQSSFLRVVEAQVEEVIAHSEIRKVEYVVVESEPAGRDVPEIPVGSVGADDLFGSRRRQALAVGALGEVVLGVTPSSFADRSRGPGGPKSPSGGECRMERFFLDQNENAG